MRLIIQHSKHYDWEPVPADVIVTDADKLSNKVRPSASGGWLMKVTKTADSYTEVVIPEAALFHTAFHGDVRSLHLSRKQAVALHLTKYVLPNHTHSRWITNIEVHDDGPDEACIKQLLADHVAAGNIDDVTLHLAAYMEAPAKGGFHADLVKGHLGSTFRVAPRAVLDAPTSAVPEVPAQNALKKKVAK